MNTQNTNDDMTDGAFRKQPAKANSPCPKAAQRPAEYREIVNNHPDLICKWLPDGTLTFANEAYCQYFRKSATELVGKTCLDYIHPDDQNKLAEHIARFGPDHTQATIELRVIDVNGRVRYHQWIDKYIVNTETGLGEFLSTGRDITELKKAELSFNRRVDFERLITKLSIDFINLSMDDMDDEITRLLSQVGDFVDVDRSYVFLYDDDLHQLSNTHEWCRDSIEPQIHNLQNISYDTIAWWSSKIRNSETIIIPEVEVLPAEAQAFKESLIDQGIRSVIGVPLVNAGNILGFVGFDAVRKAKNWSKDDATILRIIGGIIGSAIAQNRNQAKLSEERKYLEQLNEITFASLNSHNIHEMLGVMSGKITALINADNCSINLWDQELGKISASAHSGQLNQDPENPIAKANTNSITAKVSMTGQLLAIEDVLESEYGDQSVSKHFSTRALLAVPMVADDKKLGVVIFGFENVHNFTSHEIALAQQASSQIAQAILKQRLLEQAQNSAREAETLHKAGTIVASTLESTIAVESILDQLELVVPFDSASVQILDNGHLEIKAGKGWPEGQDPVGIRFPVPGDNPNSKVILSGKPYVLNNAPDVYTIFDDPMHTNIRSWLGVPLKVHDRVIGMLTLDHHESNFYTNAGLINLVSAFADQVAIAHENARLYAEERRRVQELDALRATTADITKELALENLLQAILERATALMNATGGELGLSNETGEKIVILVSHEMGPNKVGAEINPGEGLMGYVAKTRQIELIEDYKNWDGRMDSYQQIQIHAAIAAPLMIGNHFLGVIGIMNSDRARKFSESEKSLMNLFAQQAAIAVQNAQLYEERRLQARMDLTTGIYNRRGLYELGDREIDRSQRFKRHLAGIMIDIDHFKRVNDAYGHPVGDIVLKELAERLNDNLRSIDILARYGGEEFLILLPETTAEGAFEVAERLRRVVAQEPFTPAGLSLPVTISLGIAVTAGNGCDLETLIKYADDALYESKNSGRNQVHVASMQL